MNFQITSYFLEQYIERFPIEYHHKMLKYAAIIGFDYMFRKLGSHFDINHVKKIVGS